MPYEHQTEPLLPRASFIIRLIRHFAAASGLIFGSLLVGMVGYHSLEGYGWVDAFLNAAMLLGGMGPVGELHTVAGKIFAGCYALFAGLLFLVVLGIVLAPAIHRLLHRLHLELAEDHDIE